MESSASEPKSQRNAQEDPRELLVRARTGDRIALEKLLAAVAPAVHRFGLRMCRNAHDADDVLQDTLLNVAEHLDDFAGRSSLSSWIFALTRSACARKRRGLKNRPPVSDSHLVEKPDDAPSPEARTADQELAAALRAALERLPDDQLAVILLRDVEGLTAPEAAEALGISVDALKSRLHRAREALRETLRPKLEPASEAAFVGCPDVVALWSRKLEGDLSQADCSAMEKHLSSCRACGDACNALKQALTACRRIGTEAVPPEIQASVKRAMRVWTAKQAHARRPNAG